ncbi:GEVED domain-containing protein [Hymenobacter properus]|uniref:PKD domain-containing protein n=1 Tax=Hymenobacter properus TaxID=2791026 RepID=A0A931BDT1_9BACT|nr:GEVED domain-containing protein [Hymenobacter properus]MBF9140706.1 PKD domain-containing protein [Hymenobacter properus]MBR7719514.1 PKD domain-containing protein [Microvirga sp. SRT04]
MLPLLRSWSRVASGVAAVLLSLGISSAAEAQTCPINAACTPGSASVSNPALYGMAILNVTVGTNVLANRTTYLAGYHDYSCTQNAALVVGQPYSISVRTTTTAAQNVRVWIDYNNDGAFTGNNELVFSSDNATTHSGTFTAPATATLGARLRMRVATDYANSPIPTSCSTPVYSQDEDYSVTLSANAAPPVAAFTTSATTTCTGCVQFTDASQNVPTAWLWTFGDGQTSNAQNPNHCYTTAGTYAVTLRATNAAGNNTTAATSITYNTQVPVAAACTPTTVNYFGNYGITRFRLGTIDNTSADGSAGYQNFTCTQRVELMVGLSTQMIITTGGTNAHDIRVYLDANNNGTFDTGEQIYQSLSTPSPGATANITLPATVTLNQPLRLRVIADAVGNSTSPCSNQVSGQAEDYTLIARPNTSPPLVSFTSNYVAGGCVNPVQFTDASQNAPTSWLWNFGDGQTSTAQNPSHQYTTAGTFTVSLTATNNNGSATTTRLNYLTIQLPCFTYCAANGTGGMGPGGVQQASPFYITSVAVTNAQPSYNNVTGNATGGYGNYTGNPIAMGASRTVNLTMAVNLTTSHRVAVWVDQNQNGLFDTSELLSSAVPTTLSYSTTFTVNSPAAGASLRMRVMTAANANNPLACSVNLLNAEYEDYQLVFGPLASRQEQALPSLSLYPTPTPDGRVHLRLPDASAAGTYSAAVQNLLGATLLSTSLRLGPAADAELDLSRLAPGVYLLQLRDAQGQTAVRRVVRE